MRSDPGSLSDTFVVLGPELGATRVPVSPTVYEELDRRFGGFKGHVLVSMHAFNGDWPTWESHPAGDEIVVLLSGAAQFVLDHGGRHEGVELASPGAFVIVPRGTWHTARIAATATLLFITPGEGTRNEERP